ncbi:hypothetical protein Lesp01_25770 [Lentzea sp. NBRC 102530]|nr:hypothetical protein Lesp01_25770 [Lentzea sp. NBRC 102530]
MSIRTAASRDISHLMPNWGDLISPVKEGRKEANNAFCATDRQKREEKDGT